MLPVPLTFGVSNPVLFDIVVQHWLLAIDRDCIAVGLSFESPPVGTICNTTKYVYAIKIYIVHRDLKKGKV